MENTRTVARRIRFRMAGYLFTYRKEDGAQVRLDMWREDPTTGERHWVTVAMCPSEKTAAKAVALAMIAWLRSLEVAPRTDAKAMAAAESFTMLQARMAMRTLQGRPANDAYDAKKGVAGVWVHIGRPKVAAA